MLVPTADPVPPAVCRALLAFVLPVACPQGAARIPPDDRLSAPFRAAFRLPLGFRFRRGWRATAKAVRLLPPGVSAGLPQPHAALARPVETAPAGLHRICFPALASTRHSLHLRFAGFSLRGWPPEGPTSWFSDTAADTVAATFRLLSFVPIQRPKSLKRCLKNRLPMDEGCARCLSRTRGWRPTYPQAALSWWTTSRQRE